ncbi:Phospho-2-dehydro-3-deoxyheptonate aldolase, Tyr-sensitive [Chlamydiales bacterium SCGC AB-751-O23]|jgi:3-deoxy-7-phosphoheptulonate synthase|nr:Phospho-2-dehydro-3-deoxyheptonate aldolase, Tyr-sensitive [Chlamydiales bacterium SCGC AB-751-O23]
MSLAQSLTSPRKLKNLYPIGAQTIESINKFNKTVKSIIQGEDSRKLLILGPCSVHSSSEFLHYAQKFKELQLQVEERFFCVLRVYIEKPRSCLGWKGMLYDPYLDGSYDLEAGLRECRKLLVKLADMHIPLAMEFLEPLTSVYFQDLISWGSIGARTSSSQIHRQMSSRLNCAVGFKNATDGNIDVACAGALSSSKPHVFFGTDDMGMLSKLSSKGNSYAHLVLRGSYEGSNYNVDAIGHGLRTLAAFGLRQRMIIDCAHGNSAKTIQGQLRAFQNIAQQWTSGADYIVGAMLESYLASGRQELREQVDLKEGLSITDPCLSFEQTQEAVFQAYESLSSIYVKESSSRVEDSKVPLLQ